ncbi:PLP-dependent aminotransferase family protein [Leeia sp. TBRC 13508]|uniref:Putative 8-amino-7-oxononanoate synthase n=1 Tax=Leeia speluncae TaxID=2884804 RepID=A0ABS8D5U6_9NEIS|nr:PLP-dependent aminotransferase family protein [Leeia speluncae]MCB6183586.1 PLP-dependent aminotransferase family protein [Leeia speluncae]
MHALPVLDHKKNQPLVEQIVDQIIRNIEVKVWQVGMRLPSIRHLAQTLSVSKFTVVEAYDRLVAKGFLESRRGAGFFVAGKNQTVSAPESDTPIQRDIDTVWLMRQMLLQDSDMQKPGCGWLPTEWLMIEDTRRALRTLSRSPILRPTYYGLPAGYLPLRQQLQQRLAEMDIDARPSQILLGSGAMSMIDLILRYFLRSGDSVMIDDPSYFNFRGNLKLHRVQIIPIPRNAQGPDLEKMEQAIIQHKPRLYLTNSVLHNPLGTSIAPGIAFRLLQLAHRHDFHIVEDDIYRDLQNIPTQRLAALDQLQRVIYVGSFSKTLSANFRVGFLTAHKDLVNELTDLKLLTSITSSEAVEQVVYQLLTEGYYRKHVEKLKGKLATAMAYARPRIDKLGWKVSAEPEGGMFLWCELPEGVEAPDLAARALDAHIVLAPGNLMSTAANAKHFLRFNVAHALNGSLFDQLGRLQSSATIKHCVLSS